VSRLQDYIVAILAITLWATTGILIRTLVVDYAMPALLLAWWRDLLVALVLGAWFLLWKPQALVLPRKQWGFLAFYGMVLALFHVVWVYSVQANGAAVATVLLYSSAAFTAVLAWWLFGESLTVRKVLAVAASLGGCVLVSGAYTPDAWATNAWGIWMGLFSGLLFAAYSLTGRASGQRGLAPWVSLFYTFVWASVFQGLFNLWAWLLDGGSLFQALVPQLPFSGWFWLLALSFGPTLLGFGFYNHALSRLPASLVNLLATLEPAMTAIMAYFFLGERLTAIQIFGALVILVAVMIAQELTAPAPEAV